MHTVIETPAFLASARDARVSAEERENIVTYLSQRPDAGDLMPGTGGARKVRFAGRGKGKSGGYRVVTFYAAKDMPVFLLDIYGKGDKPDLSLADKNALRSILTDLPRVWREEVRKRTEVDRSR